MENKKKCCLETELRTSLLNGYMSLLQEQLEQFGDLDVQIDYLLDVIAEFKMKEIDTIQNQENDPDDIIENHMFDAMKYRE